MLMGSTKIVTPFDRKILSTSTSPTPSSIIRPYWNPEQPPPCTYTRRPASFFFSSSSSWVILFAASSVTVIGSATAVIFGVSCYILVRFFHQFLAQTLPCQRLLCPALVTLFQVEGMMLCCCTSYGAKNRPRSRCWSSGASVIKHW